MIARNSFLSLLVFVGLTLPVAADELTTSPQWIWPPGDAQGEVRLSRSLKLDRSIQSAQLKFAADFCEASFEINGTRVLSVLPYCQLQTLDVTRYLVRGDNELVIRAKRVPGPPAMAMSLVVSHHAGPATTVLTDEQWKAADLGRVPPEQWGVNRRGIELSPFENYEQWQQAKTDTKQKVVPKFWVARGFEVTELRVAEPAEGSWISLTFDPQGRVIISREDEGLLRMTLKEGHTSIEKVEAIAAKVQECRGLVFQGGQLIAQANNSLTLFQLKLGENSHVQEQRALLMLPGKVGHGRNDIALFGEGDQQRLYAICGDSVDLPKSGVRDFVSPLNEAKRRSPQREGFVLRGDLKTNSWDLFCAGLRNPYGIALDKTGEAFTFDADNEFDMGTPWYRPTRILQLLAGGDTGYRESTGKFPPRFHDQPDHAPPLLHIGRSSPTSVMFGYGLKGPEVYRQALYALDWTYGRVLCVHLAPRGATYRAAAELFLQGRPLNVTDVATGPDGAMYLITGGRKTQSALYRVHYTGLVQDVMPEGEHEQQAREYSAEVRLAQKALLHSESPAAGAKVEAIADQLAAADPVLRHAARIALERMPIERWRKVALQAEPVNWFALLALARARRAEDVPEILATLQRPAAEPRSLTEKWIFVRVIELCRETAPESLATASEGLGVRLIGGWSREFEVAPEGTSAELNRRIAMLLGELDDPGLPELAAKQLFPSEVQEDQLAGLLATRNAKVGWTNSSRRAQLEALNSISRMIGGAGLPPFEKWLRPQILATLSPAEQVSLKNLLEPKTVVSAEPSPKPRPLVQKWTLTELADLHGPDAEKEDATRGEVIFRDALCSRCHRVGLRGAAVGPDLTHVSRRFSRRDMLESIVSPSLSVAENYRLESLLLADGRVLTGRVLSEGDYRSEKIVLATDPLRPELTVEVDKKSISEHSATSNSPMPAGLLDSFSLAEIRDLLAYLERGPQ